MNIIEKTGWPEIEKEALFSQPISGGGLLTHIRGEKAGESGKNLKNLSKKSFECSACLHNGALVGEEEWLLRRGGFVIGQQRYALDRNQ